MIRRRLKEQITKRRTTALGVGPMSKVCVDATISLARNNNALLMLIASRRQIDSEDHGGGYVNHWTTRDFGCYVSENDKRGNVLICRDHGGPWQNSSEVDQNLSLRAAMQSAKASFQADIEAGFDIIHIDTSIDPHGVVGVDTALERLFELYEFCWSCSRRVGRDIAFEIGTEEQSGSTNSQEELIYTLDQVYKFCRTSHLPKPLFVVVQTGTRVVETRNIGSFDSPIRVPDELPSEIQVPKMVEICEKYGILMKEHNGDYLSDHALNWHPRLGIHATNVAPEFGVTESRALVHALRKNGCDQLADIFLAKAYDSGKWLKWMLPGTTATDEERAIIAGHYVFADPVIVQLKEEASQHLAQQGLNLNTILSDAVTGSILRYMKAFRLATK
jgi:hypothetical protein